MRELERERIENEQDNINIYNNIKNNLPKSTKVDELKLNKIIESGHDNCIICIDKFEINNEIITLDCSHFYHENCIITWFKQKNVCPLCKRPYNVGNNIINNGYHQFENFIYYNENEGIFDNNQNNDTMSDINFYNDNNLNESMRRGDINSILNSEFDII